MPAETRDGQRRSARAESDRDHAACRARARAQERAEPPPYLNWKPGDPPPVAKDGRRYLTSCGGKVLGLYKPGGALEVELKQHKGNCLPQDDWGTVNLGDPSSRDGKPCTVGNGVDGYVSGWRLGGRCYPSP